ncbi:5'/3'-nucleotidase SurE [Micromonospora sp. NPDC049662]|uniref:5'/3'-nucleotidase SurE n=1 Tax=Micromonospora sp. NPDC049662 TaxID=3155397 RepID=UPI003442D36F
MSALATGHSPRPLILVTNDDGIDSPGILAAAEAASRLGDVLVVAPVGQQTAMGRSYPKTPNIGVIAEVSPPKDLPNVVGYYSVEGAPAQVVSYAILELAATLPSLCISGVNYGENLGTTLTGSGTLGAAFEADSYEIPSLAVSLQVVDGDTPEGVNWGSCIAVCERFGSALLRRDVPSDVSILNINIPSDISPDTPVRRTIDSRQPFWVFRKPVREHHSVPTRLPVESELVEDTLEADSDIRALILDHSISVTPINRRLAYQGPWDSALFQA